MLVRAHLALALALVCTPQIAGSATVRVPTPTAPTMATATAAAPNTGDNTAPSTAPATRATKRVMVWTTDDAANTDSTARAAYMRGLASVNDVVDTVSPCSYYIEQAPPHGLVRKPGADTLHRALKAAGFAVQPLVGDIAGGWNMSWYRDTFASKAFADAAVREIEGGGLEGLNFDYEPHQPGDRNDSAAYMAMVQTIADRTQSLVTVDFPCGGALCDPALLAKELTGGKFMDMGTYGFAKSTTAVWAAYMNRNIATFGLGRYGLGVCPSCSKNLTAAEIAGRFAAAEAAGVTEVDFWSDVHPQDDAVWWSAIRKWKRGGGGGGGGGGSSWARWATAAGAAAAAEADPCAGLRPGTHCVGPPILPVVFPLNHTILHCPNGSRTTCPSGMYCGKSTGDPPAAQECRLLGLGGAPG